MHIHASFRVESIGWVLGSSRGLPVVKLGVPVLLSSNSGEQLVPEDCKHLFATVGRQILQIAGSTIVDVLDGGTRAG